MELIFYTVSFYILEQAKILFYSLWKIPCYINCLQSLTIYKSMKFDPPINMKIFPFTWA